MAVMTGLDLAAPGMTVADAVMTVPKVLDERASVAEVRHLLADDHVHAALLVDASGVLVTVVERNDLPAGRDDTPARSLGQIDGRVVAGDAQLRAVADRMLAERRRRLAVVDDTGRLVGLLCMKRNFTGFCSDADVLARAAEHASPPCG
jgi:CBS domain-containing protein